MPLAGVVYWFLFVGFASGACVAFPHVASGRACRGANRWFCHTGWRAAEDGYLRLMRISMPIMPDMTSATRGIGVLALISIIYGSPRGYGPGRLEEAGSV